MIPPTEYASSRGADIAYKVVGSGSRDVLFTMPFASHLETLWDAEWVDVVNRLARLGRLIIYDKRGTGLSDRDLTDLTPEQSSDDVVAVLDAAGSKRAVLIGFMDSAAIQLLTAARYPDRVEAVMAGQAIAVGHPDDEHPFGTSPETRQRVTEALRAGAWGQGMMTRIMAPETAVTPQQLAWMGRTETLAATPKAAARLFEMMSDLDLRPYLPQIRVPVLLLHDAAFPWVSAEAVQWLAARLPTATVRNIDTSSVRGTGRPLIEIPDEIEEFLLGTRTGTDADRQVATLLVTDVVALTETAVTAGDLSWMNLLMTHREAVRRTLARFGGKEIDTAGDGFLASFALPSSALRCADEILNESAAVGINVRAGVHTGEVLLQPPGVIGIAVHIAARVAALAGPGQVLFTDTVRALVMGSGFHYQALGEYKLKGVPDAWTLYALTPG